MRAVLALVAAAGLLAGCSVTDTALPGGAPSGASYRVTAAFSCPSSPVSATSTAIPSRRSPRAIASARGSSSSTTKTRTSPQSHIFLRVPFKDRA